MDDITQETPEAAVIVRHDEMICFGVPESWYELNPELESGLAWWSLLDWAVTERREGRMQAVSQLYDIEILFIETPEDALAVEVREPLHSYRADLQHVAEGLGQGEYKRAVVVQFAYNRVEDVL
jgi:hypothetical protein